MNVCTTGLACLLAMILGQVYTTRLPPHGTTCRTREAFHKLLRDQEKVDQGQAHRNVPGCMIFMNALHDVDNSADTAPDWLRSWRLSDDS